MAPRPAANVSKAMPLLAFKGKNINIRLGFDTILLVVKKWLKVDYFDLF